MRNSVKIASAFGIPIELHFTFLLLLVFVGAGGWLVFGAKEGLRYLILVISLFVSVVLHELGHSLVAMRYGVKISKIVLLPIGGVSMMEEIPRDPRKEFYISIAGPLTSFAIAALTYPLYLVTSIDAIRFLAYTNAFLGAFNLFLPAFPMDGGRVLRSILARRMDYLKATEISSALGRTLAIILALLGFFYNFWLILIALFVYIGASGEYGTTLTGAVLSDIKIVDVMAKNIKSVSPQMTIEELLDVMLKYKHMGYPVLNEDQNIVGIITFDDVRKIPTENRSKTRVGDIMVRKVIATYPDEPVVDAIRKMNEFRIGRLLVIDKEGKLAGLVSRSDVIRIVDILRLKRF